MAVGRSVPMLDSDDRVRGSVPYVANMQVPGMLHGCVLRSTLANGRITRLDASAAEGMAGVAAVVTASDFDVPGGPISLMAAMIKDQEVLARDRVRYIGQPIALVAAETAAIATAALDNISVQYEELPAVYDLMEAARDGAPLVHESSDSNVFLHGKLRHGDLEAAFSASDVVIEETFHSPIAQQTSLEPHVSLAQWDGGKLTVWTSSQGPYGVRGALAGIFAMDEPDIRVVVPPVGGGYGGKSGTRTEHFSSLLSWKAGGRPVKVLLSREEEFVTVTKHAATITVKTGVNRDGAMQARHVTAYWGAGAVSENTAALARGAMVRLVGPYRIPAVNVDSYAVYTNLPSSGAYRGAMSSQATWAYESHTDSLAKAIGMDPLEFRRRNLLHTGDEFATGETLHGIHFVECLESVVRGLEWDRPIEQPGGALKRGRGLAVMMKSTSPVTKSECRLAVDSQGILTLFTSTVEMGQGTHTALAQVTAEAMDVPLEQVRVVGPDTEITPYDANTNASRSTNMMGTAVQQAAEALKHTIVEAAAPLLDLPLDQLTIGGGRVSTLGPAPRQLTYEEIVVGSDVDAFEAAGEHSTSARLDPETGQGIGSPHYHQGAGACEVEVDTETGKVRVLRYAAASFAGRLINPELARLQNDGNVVYGMGPAMLEEMVFDAGQVVNRNLSDYMIPSFKDVPDLLTSETISEEKGEFHGIGEMTLPPVAPAIANAIYDATGVRITDLPITAERVLRGLSQ